MNYKQNILLLLVFSLLISCAQAPLIDRIKPPTTAVVLLGAYGDIYWQVVKTTDLNNKSNLFQRRGQLRKGKNIPRDNDVLAIPVTVGSDFTITHLGRSSNQNSLDVDVKWPKLKIKKEGIYYFGLVKSLARPGGMVNISFSLTSKKSESINIAKKLYPKLFEKLQPVNF